MDEHKEYDLKEIYEEPLNFPDVSQYFFENNLI